MYYRLDIKKTKENQQNNKKKEVQNSKSIQPNKHFKKKSRSPNQQKSTITKLSSVALQNEDQ